MWRRLRRRSFGPTRPVAFREQWPLVAVTLLALAIGIGFVVAVLTG